MKNTETISLKDYQKQLEAFDWYYQMSEDPSVYKRGLHEYGKLKELADTSKEHLEAFNKMKEQKYSVL